MARMDLFDKQNKYSSFNMDYKDDWHLWKKNNKKSNTIFFQIFKDFEQSHLKNIPAGALKLYVYFGLKSDQYGDSYYSINRIAEDLNVEERTVNNWIKSLKEMGLIHRDKDGKRDKCHTYLKPYGMKLFQIDGSLMTKNFKETYNNLLKKIDAEKKFYGNKIYKKYHFFQWKQNSTEQPVCVNIFVVLTQKIFKDNKSSVYGVFFSKRINKNPEYVIDTSEISKFAIFDSIYGNDILGIAVEHKKLISVESNLKEVLYDLCSFSDEEIKNFKKVPLLNFQDYKKNVNDSKNEKK